MSYEKTQFAVLLNEIVYDIFKFLTTRDILRAFVQQTPNVRQLSITFADIFTEYYTNTHDQSAYFEELIMAFHGLNNLNRLSLRTNQDDNNSAHNVLLPFKEIEGFIDRCYPILQNVVLKLDHIRYHKDIWSTIMRYKKAFARFDFYASFIIDENASIDVKSLLTNNNFDFHFEGYHRMYRHHFVHIYSLPFTFDKFHGYTLYSKLNSQISFSTVRHLYFIPTHADRNISFKYLAKSMPHLISIHFDRVCVRNDTEISIDQDIFKYLNFLQFKSYCMYEYCVCRDLLVRLLDRMPYLQCLSTTLQILIPELRLRTHDNHFQSLDVLAKCVPRLSKLLLGDLSYIEQLSPIISSLFIHLPSLVSVSFNVYQQCSRDPIPYGKILQDALIYTQNINDHLHHLKLSYESGEAIFYF